MNSRAVILNIRGKVQNVGFRYYTHKMAQKLDIKGFVKNMPDGSVYAEAEGEEASLQAFIDFCRQGPQWGRVEELSIQDAPVKGFEGFHIH